MARARAEAEAEAEADNMSTTIHYTITSIANAVQVANSAILSVVYLFGARHICIYQRGLST